MSSSDENDDSFLDSTIQQRVFCANLTAGTQVIPCVELPLLISRIALLVDEETKAKRGSLVTVSIQREDDEEPARVCNFRVGTVEQCDISLALHPLDGDVAFIVTGTVGVSLIGEELIPVSMDADGGYGEEEEEEAAARIEDEESDNDEEESDNDESDDDAMKGVTREQLVQMMKEQGHLDAGDESASDDEESDSAEDSSASDRAAFAAEVAAKKKSQKRAAPSSAAVASEKKAKKAKKTGTPSSNEADGRAASSSAPKGFLKGKEGLFYKDEVVGHGAKPKKGKRVSVHYKGWLQSGVTFDETSQKPFRFRLGLGEVVKGWDLGVASMRVGGRRTLICPPHLAYGNKSPGAPIPANATLTFEVELIKA